MSFYFATYYSQLLNILLEDNGIIPPDWWMLQDGGVRGTQNYILDRPFKAQLEPNALANPGDQM